MDLNSSLYIAVLLVLVVSVASAQDNDTVTKGLLYTMQPIDSYSCNPYGNGSKELICALYQSGGLSNHTIRWFRSTNNSGTMERELINETNTTNKEYLISRLTLPLNNSIEAEGPSDYWCQAGIQGEDNLTYEPSAVFSVLAPEEYIDYPPCTGLSLSQQVSMFAGNGSILTSVGIIDTATTLEPSPSSEQDLSLVWIVGVVVSSFFVAIISLLICVFCVVLRSRRKLSTEINFIHDIIHDTNEPSQSLTVIDIHSNESTTTPWEIENSDEYVDVGAEGISPHHLRTSPASSTNFDHRQDNAPQITVDADGIDTNNHTDLRKRPPISPKPKGKLSTEIDIIHDTNESLQSLTVISIHSNEPTTTPWEIENEDEYVDVDAAEGISPHHLRTSPANSTNFDHRQDNAPEIFYHSIDADGIDTNDYTDLRKRPPISPKPRRIKSPSPVMNCQRAFAVNGDKPSTEKKPLPLPKNKDKNRATRLKDESPFQSQIIEQPYEQDYQALSSSTKNRMELYTCPAVVSASSESIAYHNYY